MHDTRWSVLEAIKSQGHATVNSLAEQLGVTAISIRHHLNSLEGEGLIKVEMERQGVGRPKHIYKLTQAAQRYFPNNYHILVERLLDELKAKLPAEQVELIISSMAANVAARYGADQQKGGTLENRLQHLVDILGAEGFMAAVDRVDEQIVLTQINCPYVYLGQRHPEVCLIDHTLMEKVLGVDVHQTSCVLNGDRACTFNVANESKRVEKLVAEENDG
jgi:predicted ArsR family transcriptional regulator